MNPRQTAMASAPLHASVTSMGNDGVPNIRMARLPCSCVTGRSTNASTLGRRRMPKMPRLQATMRMATLRALSGGVEVSIGTQDLLHGDAARAQQPAEF